MDSFTTEKYRLIIEEISHFRWETLDKADLHAVALAYYYFSIQFRENLCEALQLYPDDRLLLELFAGECDTANLSPWPEIAKTDERLNHDEFMRRALTLSSSVWFDRGSIDAAGSDYLERARSYPAQIKACSIASYENGGLESTFRAMLRAPDWSSPTLLAFRHFLTEHIKFDSDAETGHGALSRHLTVDDQVLPLWLDFRDLLLFAAPRLAWNSSAAA
jgi:hypothetical protein